LHAVVKEGKKARVVVDCSRGLNDHLSDQHFCMPNLQDAADLSMEAGKGAWYVKLDIKSCFLSFPIHPDDQKFFYCQAGGHFFQWLTLVFGRKDAPFVVTVLLDVVSAAMRDEGVPHVRFLDDFLLVATTSVRAWVCAHVAAGILVEFGLALALEKVEGPLQRIEFLGIIIDSQKETLEISEARKFELLGLLKAFSRRRKASRRTLMSLLGKLAFASAVLPCSRPFLRRVIDVTRGRRAGGQAQLGPGFKQEVQYWRAHISVWNGRAKWLAPAATPFVFASDASTTGFAYGLESCPPAALLALPLLQQPGAVRSGVWAITNGDAERQGTSAEIQWGEFFCTLAAAVEFGPWLANSHVVFVIDNESDVHVMNRQRSREPRVAALLRALCDVAMKFNFSFVAVHRAGVLNVLMDWASRPSLHQFATQLSSPLRLPAGVVVGVGLSVGLYPPLLVPTTITHISSLCLSFDAATSSARWRPSFGGWCGSAAAYTSLARRVGPT
jgi:hypothetical protein